MIGDGCHGGGNGYNRALCAPTNLQGECKWFGKAKSCNAKCGKGWWEITQNSHAAFEKPGCQAGRYLKFCCRELWTTDSGMCYDERYATADLLSGGNSNYNKRGLDYYYPNSAPCNAANLGNALRFQNMDGWFGAGVGGHFTQVGNSFWWDPATSLQATGNQPSSTRQLRGVTTTITISVTSQTTTVRMCDGMATTQACHHYSSVIRNTPAFANLACPHTNIARNFGQAPEMASWSSQHTRPMVRHMDHWS